MLFTLPTLLRPRNRSSGQQHRTGRALAEGPTALLAGDPTDELHGTNALQRQVERMALDQIIVPEE